MSTAWHFPILVLVSYAAFIGLLRTVLRHWSEPPTWVKLKRVAAVVVVGGMLFAKVGTAHKLPIWLYYGVPAVITWTVPPLAFRMRRREVASYLVLALLLAPMIHLAFSFFLGWKEYLPFLPVPSVAELLG